MAEANNTVTDQGTPPNVKKLKLESGKVLIKRSLSIQRLTPLYVCETTAHMYMYMAIAVCKISQVVHIEGRL